MRGFLAVGVLAVATSVAHAEDAVCSLRVLEAPDEVRAALVGWASGEKMCHALEVRITPTGEGYSLWARAEDGRTFTRWVADPKTAALLVVSWAGDDTLPTADPPPRYTLKTHVRQVVPQATVEPRVVAGVPRDRSRQITVAMIANAGAGEDVHARTGIRASIDLVAHEAWRAGIAGMISDEKVNIYDYRVGMRVAQAYEPRASVMGYIARSMASERIRLGAGAGFAYMQLSDVDVAPGVGTVMIERVGIFAPALELSALASFPVTRRWSITGGLVITATGPSATLGLLKDENHTFAPNHDEGTQVVGAFGVTRSL